MLFLGISVQPLSAHEASVSHITLQQGLSQTQARIVLPDDQLTIAWPDYAGFGAQPAAAEQVRIQAYVRQHFWLEQDGHKLTGTLLSAERTTEDQAGLERPVLTLSLLFPPLTSASDQVSIHSDLILHEVYSHKTYLLSQTPGAPQNLNSDQIRSEAQGIFRLKHTDITLGSAPSVGATLLAFMHLGAEHILSGPDHLLFLTCLLMTVPLVRYRGRWERNEDASATTGILLRTLSVVTGFTLAHGLTLSLAVLGYLPAGGQWIEVLIAVSVLTAALLIVKPLPHIDGFWVATLFGLIHGLAFSELLDSMHLTGNDLLLALFSFTLGIEAVQMVLILLLVPCLIRLSHSPTIYNPLRYGVALISVTAASGWLFERITGQDNLLTPMAGWIKDGAPFFFGLIILLTLASVRSRPRMIDLMNLSRR